MKNVQKFDKNDKVLILGIIRNDQDFQGDSNNESFPLDGTFPRMPAVDYYMVEPDELERIIEAEFGHGCFGCSTQSTRQAIENSRKLQKFLNLKEVFECVIKHSLIVEHSVHVLYKQL